MARLFSDEDFPVEIVHILRSLGHDAVTTREAGWANRGTRDPEILQIAAADGRAVPTRNRRHCMRLHLQHGDHAGIIVCTVDQDFARQARRIHAAISAHDSLDGLLIRVNRPGPDEEDA